MKTIVKKWKQKYGYKPSLNEIYTHYTQGYLILTDKEENEILKQIQNN
jgi:hypothetical protein